MHSDELEQVARPLEEEVDAVATTDVESADVDDVEKREKKRSTYDVTTSGSIWLATDRREEQKTMRHIKCMR